MAPMTGAVEAAAVVAGVAVVTGFAAWPLSVRPRSGHPGRRGLAQRLLEGLGQVVLVVFLRKVGADQLVQHEQEQHHPGGYEPETGLAHDPPDRSERCRTAAPGGWPRLWGARVRRRACVGRGHLLLRVEGAPRSFGAPSAQRRQGWQTNWMPVLLIRHAHAGSRKDWKGDDRLRPVSDKGQAQAIALVRALDGWAVQRVLSSPYTRCMQTVAPLAEALGVKVEAVIELGEGHGPDAVHLVRSLVSEKVALCTHGDVIADILVALADEDRLDLGRRPRQAKGSTWILEANGRVFKRATYLPRRPESRVPEPGPPWPTSVVEGWADADLGQGGLRPAGAGRTGAPGAAARSRARCWPRPRDIPPRFLESILAELRQRAILLSRRGAEGGYWLARPAIRSPSPR